jgi:hypothetical protein
MLWTVIKTELIGRAPYLFQFHAALVGLNDAAILLPAAPGSGKTTLTVAATASGLRYLSDELTLVGADFRAQGVPMPPCIKAEGWAVVQRWDPRVDTVAPLRRRDGVRVKYLVQGYLEQARQCLPAMQVRAIAFPRYRADGEDLVRPLSPAECFDRLFAQCLTVGRPLTSVDLVCLLAFLGRTPAVELTYSTTDYALMQLRRLLAAPSG